MSTINVNLSMCPLCGPTIHPHGCSGTPVLIPCPVPRSVTFEVRLRDCGHRDGHPITCPWPVGYVVKVSCSISGKTWAESEVVEVDRMGSTVWADWDNDVQREAALTVCRERWALVKALLLNTAPAEHPVCTATLLSQRTEVFSALADMARAEEALEAATGRVNGLLQRPPPAPGRQLFEARDSQAEEALRIYVERLVEQVGVMT